MGNINEYGKDRNEYLGAYDIASILGVNPWSTALKVYNVKKGIEPPDEPNIAMTLGIKLENYIKELYEKESGLKVNRGIFAVHPDYNYICGSLDGTIDDDIVVDYKSTTSKSCLHMQLSEIYKIQGNLYMGLTGRKKCEFAVLYLDTKKFFIIKIDFDKDYYDFLISEAVSFWNNHIIANVPPAPSTNQELSAKFSRAISGSTIEASADILTAIAEISSIKEQIKALEKQKDANEFIIREAFGNNEVMTSNNKVIATYKNSARNTIDTEALRRECPEIATRYQVTKSTRTLLLK